MIDIRFQVLQHQVIGTPQFSSFIRPVDGDFIAEIALSDRRQFGDQLVNRLGDVADDPKCQQTKE